METTLRVLIALGFAGLLILLRLDSERFGAADYDERGPEGPPSIRGRLAWYAIGIVLVFATILIHPAPVEELRLTLGDRGGALLGGLAFGALGTAGAAGIAWLRYKRLRLPAPGSYPGAIVNATATAFIDEAAFRGALLGFIVLAGVDTTTAIVLQTLVYGLATRLGAAGRDRYALLLALAVAFVGGWLTIETGGIGAAFLGHVTTRIAVFVFTGHAGQVAPLDRDLEEAERRRRPPEGWRVIGGRDGREVREGPPPRGRGDALGREATPPRR